MSAITISTDTAGLAVGAGAAPGAGAALEPLAPESGHPVWMKAPGSSVLRALA